MSLQLTLISLCGLLIISLVVASGGLWIWGIIRYSSGEPILKDRFRSPYAKVSLFALLLTGAYLLMGLYSTLTPGEKLEYNPERIERLLHASIVEGVILTSILGLAIYVSAGRVTELYRLGFRFDNLPRQILDGWLGFVAAILPVFIAILITLPLRSLEQTHPFLRFLSDKESMSALLTVIYAAVIMAPLKEELMFRVILQTWLVKKIGVTWGIVVTAILFAAVHGIPDSLGLLPLALILGIVYHVRRSYLTVVIIHALFNGFNVGLVMLQKSAEQVLENPNILSP
ncbi:CPBP family intramembrane glutamic endopeptidase [Thalassoglobus polymorphus]|uniref:CAAX amino terminal protease self-immunity n=1 Tax=Thalassoglobus polymorphus TaxID=2527994 RepID=A0A517QHP8_9PLAN|nr:CPBP family intramembrane glutamic endopeptidase [Thalassoglobus polymorphus]QDT31087.1 CAAX amino terminal protease self- immunity [Thalassoglobus polymorphus]